MSRTGIGIDRFKAFKSWGRLVMTICRIKCVASSFRTGSSCRGWRNCDLHQSLKVYEEAEQFVLKELQCESFPEEMTCLQQGQPLPKGSQLANLNPFIDEAGLLRVGGRLNKAVSALGHAMVNPVILPRGHYISTLIIRHFHESVKHQGMLFTEGAIRNNGYLILGAKRAVSSVLHKCVRCRRLRGEGQQQLMAGLPLDRINSRASVYVSRRPHFWTVEGCHAENKRRSRQ